ncbi:hypothetical protein [Nocardia nepalensis]|uniref:hypothetical protein n=1 Tax=Nocardia nepalensis TaxID=3375448 RepID=UPI003B67BB93
MKWLKQPRGYQDPRYYTDAATDTEANLRAAYAQRYNLALIANHGESPESIAELHGYIAELDKTWGAHESAECRKLWHESKAATDVWHARPETARRHFARIAASRESGDLVVDEKDWRTLRQACEITGHADGQPYGSVQDGAGWRSPGPRLRSMTNTADLEAQPTGRPPTDVASETTTEAARSNLSLVDRALGATPGARQFSMAEVEAVLADTDAALNWEEVHTSLVPAVIRDAQITFDYTDIADRHAEQAAMLREVQNLAAEHTRLVDHWDGPREEDQARIERLELLRDGLGQARIDALESGLDQADVDAAYHAGLEGSRWSEQPAHPHLGHIELLTAERDHAHAEAQSLRETVNDLRRQLEHPAAAPTGTETEAAPTLSTPETVNSTIGADGGGGAIGKAIDAAITDDAGTDWDLDDTSAPIEPVHSSARIEAGQEATG